jgi:hypothetical protein
MLNVKLRTVHFECYSEKVAIVDTDEPDIKLYHLVSLTIICKRFCILFQLKTLIVGNIVLETAL